jgi:hypothetical protein
MKWFAAAAAVLMSGCIPEFTNPHLETRGLTEEDLKAPPGATEIKSAIVNDVRNRRSLRYFLEDGTLTVPQEIKLVKNGVEAVRAKDSFELWRVTVWQDHIELRNGVTETAYWDNENFVYFYHYEGGNPHRDVWMGPFPIKFAKRPDTSHEH